MSTSLWLLESESESESVVGGGGVGDGGVGDGGAGVSPAKRGRPARTKVVKEVDWLEGLSSGVEVGRELELVVVGGDEKETKKAEALALKEAKKAEALAAKEAKKAEELALKETKKAEELALKETKKAEALAAKAAKNTPEAKEAA